MNERIRDIALECSVEYIASPVWAFSEAELKKFGEMIVKECASVLRAEMDRLDAIPGREISAQAMETAQVLIKKHFGVE